MRKNGKCLKHLGMFTENVKNDLIFFNQVRYPKKIIHMYY